MSDLTASTGGSTTFHVVPQRKVAPAHRGSVTVEFSLEPQHFADEFYRDGGSLVLRPTDALGEYLLRHFGHGELRCEWRSIGTRFDALVIRHHPKPMLGSKGGDPFYVGVTVSDEEAAWLREQLDARRNPKRPKKRRSRR